MKKILIITILLLEISLFLYSKEITEEFKITINICLYSLMPTMFFSILLSNLLKLNNFYIPKTISNLFYKVFNISKENLSILFLSLISGYPNNIKLLKDSDNEYFNYVTNFVNPIFFIGTVYNLYLKDIKVTIIILISHYISTFILLYILKNKYISSNITKNNYSLSETYFISIKNTINTLSIIFSNLLFISLLITLLKLLFKNNFLFIGLIEFSKGIYEVSLTNINIYIKGLLILIFITFGSISIHFQAISINNKIKYIKYLFYRILNVFISIIIYLLLYKIYK